MLTVIAYPGLIAPVDLGLLLFRLGLDLRILLFQPSLYRPRILFIDPLDRFLRRKTPALQYSPTVRIGMVMPVSCSISSITALRVHSA